MEDKSVIKPILDALEYLVYSNYELQNYYHLIDKFSAQWFTKEDALSSLDKMDFFLIHEILSEFLRFESNSKRVALWLLSINRVCYNYTVDLSAVKTELANVKLTLEEQPDNTLIEPILQTIKELEKKHQQVSISDVGKKDTIGNFLQWVDLYVTYIYPSLENKLDLNDKNMIKAMNYLLMEFINQKSNDKRLAFLIIAIYEACRLYSLQHMDYSTLLNKSKASSQLLPGIEEGFVEELLDRLKQENEKQRQCPLLAKEVLADQFIKDSFDRFIEEVNEDVNESISIFNQYVANLAGKLLSFEEEKQYQFIQTLFHYRANCKDCLKDAVHNNIKNSVSLLSEQLREWIKNELEKIDEQSEIYIEYILQKLKSNQATKANTAKLFMMLCLIKKLTLNQDESV